MASRCCGIALEISLKCMLSVWRHNLIESYILNNSTGQHRHRGSLTYSVPNTVILCDKESSISVGMVLIEENIPCSSLIGIDVNYWIVLASTMFASGIVQPMLSYQGRLECQTLSRRLVRA